MPGHGPFGACTGSLRAPEVDETFDGFANFAAVVRQRPYRVKRTTRGE